MHDLLTIGRVAAAANVRAGTIRYYEQVGLLPRPARTPAGYRLYPVSVVDRLTVIRNAQQFGFSLREIASFLQARDRGGAPCRNVREVAQQVLAAVDAQIAALMARRRRMTDTLRRWDERLDRTPVNERAHLLQMLGDRKGRDHPVLSARKQR